MRVQKGFGKRGIICSAVFVRGSLLPRQAMYLHGRRRSTLDSVRTYVLTVLCRKTRVKCYTGDCQPLLSAGDSAVCPEKDILRPVIGPLLLPGCLGISRATRHVPMHVTFPSLGSRFLQSSSSRSGPHIVDDCGILCCIACMLGLCLTALAFVPLYALWLDANEPNRTDFRRKESGSLRPAGFPAPFVVAALRSRRVTFVL